MDNGIKHPGFTFAAFREWASQQPPEKRINQSDWRRCAVGEWVASIPGGLDERRIPRGYRAFNDFVEEVFYLDPKYVDDECALGCATYGELQAKLEGMPK